MRLRDGTDPSNGRVEICQHRTWGAVCSDEWDDNAARVVCGQLLYDPEGECIVLVFSVSKCIITQMLGLWRVLERTRESQCFLTRWPALEQRHISIGAQMQYQLVNVMLWVSRVEKAQVSCL